jgi:hypothetical protein
VHDARLFIFKFNLVTFHRADARQRLNGHLQVGEGQAASLKNFLNECTYANYLGSNRMRQTHKTQHGGA